MKGEERQNHHYAEMCYPVIRAKSRMTGTPEIQSRLKHLLMPFLQVGVICQNQRVAEELM